MGIPFLTIDCSVGCLLVHSILFVRRVYPARRRNTEQDKPEASLVRTLAIFSLRQVAS